MVSTQSSLRHETPLEDSHPHPAAMTDIDTLQQLQNHIVETERRHEEELRKLKADHDNLEACIRHPRSNKRHKLDKHKSFPKGLKYERYTSLAVNCTTILEEAFNLEVPIRPPMKPPKSGLDATKYCRYHHGIGHNTEDCWALKDKIKELIQAGYLA
ncbi:hypothetical protein GmHk_U059439 [Glycine max]|nr:hypothetical protein GmHk_U059439 [Glycine max]